MKLAKVTHIRCHQRDFNEPETYVWVDDQMTPEEFTALVKAAQDAYDQAGVDFDTAEKPPYVQWGIPPYNEFPDKTVAEVKAEHKAAQARYEEWKDRKRKAQLNFACHLVTVSNGRAERFENRKPDLSFVLDWGHRHGQKTAYGETEIYDLPGLVAEEGY